MPASGFRQPLPAQRRATTPDHGAALVGLMTLQAALGLAFRGHYREVPPQRGLPLRVSEQAKAVPLVEANRPDRRSRPVFCRSRRSQ
jgi:hypothetical protein